MSEPRNPGCLQLIVEFVGAVFVTYAILEGLETPWGIFHLDFFPPAIRLQ